MNKNYVAQELKKRLENRTTQFLDLTMKNGDKVTIDDCFGYYIWFSAVHEGTRAETLEEVAEILINHPAKQNELVAEEERYFAENEPKLKAYFKENFEGKTWEEIRNDEELYDCWGYYSDWHKDVYGYRPHDIVCGTYVNPHVGY